MQSDLLLHSLRLAGNSCADTDENRKIVVDDNYTLAILRHSVNPELIQVAIPVIYNICMDFGKTPIVPTSKSHKLIKHIRTEPAHVQLASNQTAYIFSYLLRDGSLDDNDSLLNFVCDLIELATEQGMSSLLSTDTFILTNTHQLKLSISLQLE